mmetsp:Transcript_71794/g.119457  ORF Transcript_71794/g.119457 Transcript_71794/m.119457 type:complete len:412 (+) Transcript_71794:972-2207(+)
MHEGEEFGTFEDLLRVQVQTLKQLEIEWLRHPVAAFGKEFRLRRAVGRLSKLIAALRTLILARRLTFLPIAFFLIFCLLSTSKLAGRALRDRLLDAHAAASALGRHMYLALRHLGLRMQDAGAFRAAVWKELREFAKQIRMIPEKCRNLLIDLLDGSLLLLVRVQNLKESFVGLRLFGEARLDFSDVIDGLVKLNGGLLRELGWWWLGRRRRLWLMNRTKRLGVRLWDCAHRRWRYLRHVHSWGRLSRRATVARRLGAGHPRWILELDPWLVLVITELDLVTRWQERVEAEDQLAMAVKELEHTVYDTRGVDALRLELFHNIKELIVDVWLFLKFHLHLVKVCKCIFHLQLPVRRERTGWSTCGHWHARWQWPLLRRHQRRFGCHESWSKLCALHHWLLWHESRTEDCLAA